jgi:hypothetical protein
MQRATSRARRFRVMEGSGAEVCFALVFSCSEEVPPPSHSLPLLQLQLRPAHPHAARAGDDAAAAVAGREQRARG